MRILFTLGTLNKGGAERVVANISNYLAKRNNEIHIVTTLKEKSFYKLNEKINLYGLDNRIKYNFIMKNIKRLKKLKKILEEINPDVIISFLPEPSYRILFLKMFNHKLKVIVSVRNDPKIHP